MPLPPNTIMVTVDVTSLTPMISLPLNNSLSNTFPTPYHPLSSLSNLPSLSSPTTITPSTPGITYRLRELIWAHVWPFPMQTLSWVSLNRITFLIVSLC